MLHLHSIKNCNKPATQDGGWHKCPGARWDKEATDGKSPNCDNIVSIIAIVSVIAIVDDIAIIAIVAIIAIGSVIAIVDANNTNLP